MHVPKAPMVEQSVTRRPHFASLDALRGLAALTVVLYHMDWINPVQHYFGLVRNGYLMVDVFFVLSGFVVFYSYGANLDTPERIGRFVWLRFWRLYPIHFTFLIVMFAAEGAATVFGWRSASPGFQIGLGHDVAYTLLTNVFLVQGLHTYNALTYNDPSWTISVEFYTYLVMAALVFACRTRRAVAAMSAIACAAGVATLVSLGPKPLTFTCDYGIFRCVAGYFLGVLTYCAYDALRRARPFRDRPRWIDAAALAVLIAVVIVLSVKPPAKYGDLFIYPATALSIFLLAMSGSEGPTRFLLSPVLQWLGAISYSLYMAQYIVIWSAKSLLPVIIHALHAPGAHGPDSHFSAEIGAVSVVVCLALVLLLGALACRWIEMPLRRWSRGIARQWVASPV